MQLVSGKEAAQRIQKLVSEKHQVHAYAVELSAKQIYGLAPTGQVDFGGSEYVAAERQPVSTHQKHSQDNYQWWTLMHGAYLVEFNETLELAEDEMALLEPHERLLRAGAEHPALYLRGKQNPLTVLLSVASARVELKQNARISTLRVFRLANARIRAGAPHPAKAPAKKKKR